MPGRATEAGLIPCKPSGDSTGTARGYFSADSQAPRQPWPAGLPGRCPSPPSTARPLADVADQVHSVPPRRLGPDTEMRMDRLRAAARSGYRVSHAGFPACPLRRLRGTEGPSLQRAHCSGRLGRRIPRRLARHPGSGERAGDGGQLTSHGSDPAGLARYPLRQRGSSRLGPDCRLIRPGRGRRPRGLRRRIVPGVGRNIRRAAGYRGQQHGQQDQA
jgi:hypothetical protein